MDIFTLTAQQIQLSLFLMLRTFLTRRTGHGSCTEAGDRCVEMGDRAAWESMQVLSKDDDGRLPHAGYGLFSPTTILTV